MPFDYRDDLAVEWIGHPAWYFRLSKSAIPWLRHPCGAAHAGGSTTSTRCPPTAATLVLKPLFSFAGGGIVFAPTDGRPRRDSGADAALYLLQERMAFTPVIETPHGADAGRDPRDVPVDRPVAGVLPLIRMGRGTMMGVAHNQGLAWVGASAGFAVRP